jgi:hypothetical protein
VTGPQGPQGPQGVTGPQGPQGPIGGSDTQILYNDGGTTAGSANLTFNKSGNTLTFGTTVIVASASNANVNFNSGALYVDGVANEIGIGTVDPTQKLDVRGNIAVGSLTSNAAIFMYGSAGDLRAQLLVNGSSFIIDSDSTIDFQPGNTLKMRVDPTGNLGLSIVSPTSTLHVVGNANITANLTTTFKSVKDTIIANTTTNGANTVNLQDSNYFRHVLTANSTFTFTNAPASGTGQLFSLLILQDGTGGRTVSWGNTIYWAGGSAPPATTNANARDLWTFITYDAGSTYWGTLAIKDAR